MMYIIYIIIWALLLVLYYSGEECKEDIMIEFEKISNDIIKNRREYGI